jgi:MFS family permease
MPPSSALSTFMDGVRDSVPMLVGAAPFGMIFGALVGTTQLAPWQGQLMSLSVFAGSSQFIGIGLMAGLAGRHCDRCGRRFATDPIAPAQGDNREPGLSATVTITGMAVITFVIKALVYFLCCYVPQQGVSC